MSEPFHVCETADDRRSSRRGPIVLARIPCVGAAIGATPEFTPVIPPEPTSCDTSGRQEPLPETHYFVDAQHSPAPVADLAPSDEPTTDSQQSAESRPATRLRYDESHDSCRSPGARPGVAGGLSRLHGEVTSYSGLILTLVLAASGALLYWMMIVSGQTPVADYQNSYETIGTAEVVIPDFAAPAASSTSSPAVSSTAPPVTPIAIAAAQAEAAVAPVETTTETAPKLIQPVLLPAPPDEPPVFGNVRAESYPSTEHPEQFEPMLPPTPIRVSRQR